MRRFTLMTTLLLALACVSTTAAAAPEDGNALTVWLVIWNNPENCVGGPIFEGGLCSEADFATPGVNVSVIHLTGGVTRLNGKFQLTGSVYKTARKANPSAGLDPFDLNIGLRRPKQAEVHVVIRDHGQAYDDMVHEQITAYMEPSCLEMGGPNTCVDVQFSVHVGGADSVSAVYDFATGAPIDRATARLIRSDDAITVIFRSQVDR